MKWFFIPLLENNNEIYVGPLFLDHTYPLEYWTENDLNKWLKLYGMISLGDSDDKKKLVSLLQPFVKIGQLKQRFKYVWNRNTNEKMYMLPSALAAVIQEPCN